MVVPAVAAVAAFAMSVVAMMIPPAMKGVIFVGNESRDDIVGFFVVASIMLERVVAVESIAAAAAAGDRLDPGPVV